MRSIINISVPAKVKKEVELEVKKGGYSTKSEFFRDLLRLWQEEKALKRLRESQKEFAKGKGRTLKSLRDLR